MVKKVFNNPGGYTSQNNIQLVRGGAPYFSLLEQLIDQAKETIHFQVYIFDSDETGSRILQALIRAASRQVQVYMLLDGYASGALSKEAQAEIKGAGIHFRWFEPLFNGHNFFVGRRMHHKVFVADAMESLVGGLNISNRYNDMPGEPAWLDWAAYCTGQVSTELYNRCIQMWFRRPPTTRNLVSRSNLAATQDCFVRVRINDWVRNKNQISRTYLEMFRQAQSRITIMSSYFMPGRVFRKNLRLASQRGLKIRIILTKNSDVALAKHAERFFYPWLLRRNIEIYEYRKKVLHGKMATCDGQWVTIGSFNFNDLSAYASIELNLDVHDHSFSKVVDQALEKIIAEDCDRITEESLTRDTTFLHTAIYRVAYGVVRMFLFVFTFHFKHEKS